jgi:hypothetical protein
MSSAIHLFKLAKMNSEIKYLLHSITHQAPPFTYPHVPDIGLWQRDAISRLDSWADQIPQYTGDRIYQTMLCEIKYHGLMTLLLRPSPAIPSPSNESLKLCYQHSVASIRLYDQLYKKDLMIYSWATVHSIFLATITMLYCIWSVPEVAAQIELEVLMADLKAGSNVLSATGEYWSEAKRSIPVLDGLSSATIRWIVDYKTKNSGRPSHDSQNIRPPLLLGENSNIGAGRIRFDDLSSVRLRQSGVGNGGNGALPIENFGPQRQDIEYDFPLAGDFGGGVANGIGGGNQYFGSDFYTSLFGDDSLMDQIDFNNPSTVNNMMQGLFSGSELQGGGLYDFGNGQGYGVDQMMGGNGGQS